MDDQTNKIGLAGDWHGAYTWTRHALHTMGQAGIKDVFHLGDFSLGWPGKWPDLINICESICKRYDMRLWITPGNHENWAWVDSREYVDGEHWMTPHTCLLQRNWRSGLLVITRPDGSYIERTILSLGGAQSVDYATRIEGLDWFPEECMTLKDAKRAAREGHADIMLCHDAPDGGTLRVQQILDTPHQQSMWPSEALRRAAVHRNLLNMAVYGCYENDGSTLPGVNPKVFAHGHMHAYDTRQTEDTLFLSLGCNNQEGNLMVLDLDTLEATELPIIQTSIEIEKIEREFKQADAARRIKAKAGNIDGI